MVKDNKPKETIENRYDKTLKELLENKTLMRELITGFINEDWIKNLDFRTLKKEKTDFLSEDLKEFRKDLLWSIKFKKNKNISKLYFYIHIEFQSTPDRTMPFRFLIYDSLLHIDILNSRKRKEKSNKLPFILPVLFYVGENNWNFEFDLTKLIEQPFENAVNYIPEFDIFKIMLNEKSLDDLRNIDNLLANILATDNKEINEQSLKEIVIKMKQILSGYDKEKELIMLDKINKFMTLISSDKIDVEEALQTLNKEEKVGGFSILLDKKEQEGIEKGIEKGEEKAKIEFARRMLKANIEIEQIAEFSELPLEKIKELQKEL